MTDTSRQISFSLHRPDGSSETLTFDRAIITVGKLSTSNLRLDDVSVSRKHAVIERRENGEWRITDLGSTNGTQVNEKTIVQANLTDGDTVTIGETQLVAHLVGGPPEAPAPRPKPRAGAKGPALRGLGQDTFFDQRDTRSAAGPAGLEVALLWGETVLSIEDFPRPVPIYIGEAPGCRFTLPSEAMGTDRFALVIPRHGKFALNISNPGIEGEILLDGNVHSLEDLRQGDDGERTHFTIDKNTRARLRSGEFTILLSHGPLSSRPPMGRPTTQSLIPLIFILLSFVMHASFLATIFLQPDASLRSHLDAKERKAQFIKVLKMKKEEEKPKEEEKKEEKEKLRHKEKGEGKEKELEKEKRDRLPKSHRRTKRKSPLMDHLSDKERKKMIDKIVTNTETVKTLDRELSKLVSLDNTDVKFKALAARGGEASNVAGADIDPFGGGSMGGGGDFAGQSIGGNADSRRGGVIAGLDKKSLKRGKNDPTLHDRKGKIVALRGSVSGSLDRKTVRKYIRRRLSGIRWCYQNSLQRNSRLSGKIKLRFKIRPNGSVSSVSVAGNITDPGLRQCIVRKVKRWRFPQPKDGTNVKVSYPVLLKPR